MFNENPTGGDAGASIQDRLERYLGAGSEPAEDQRRAPQEADKTSQDHDDGQGNGDADKGHQDAPDANAQQDHDDNHEGDGEGASETQYTTADFAKVMGIEETAIDVDADGNVMIRTKIDGKDGTAKFADVLKSYQLQGHVDNKAREVAAKEQQLQQQHQQADQAVTQRLGQLDHIINTVGEELLREFHSIDWNTLRATDSAEYSARILDFNSRKAQLDAAIKYGQDQRAEVDGRKSQEMQQYVASEFRRLPELIPEWKDSVVANKEVDELRQWSAKVGFPPEIMNSITSAVAVQSMRKAMMWDRLQEGKANVENKVRTAPKIIKAGAAQPGSRDQQNVRSLHANIKKTGGSKDAIAKWLLATGKA